MDQSQAQKRFGTFSGVFTPSILTIIGVILFLRTGFVVGNAGIINGIFIIILAEIIVLLTALSISAIATNTEVKVGGAYFLISRSLGPEFGGSIGLVLYLSQAISVSFYIVGFTEAFKVTFSGLDLSPRVISTIICILLFTIVFIGAGWPIKAQFFILAALGVSLISFIIGAGLKFNPDIFQANMTSGYAEGYSFFTVFAIFFPAVTGILAGVNMSGDLKDPGKNIPRGVLTAIFSGMIVYIGFSLLLGGNFTRDVLINDSTVMRLRSIIPFALWVGVFAATLSSAIGSFMGAPRVLQALGGDEIFGMLRIFSRGSGKTNEPRISIILTFLLAEAAILLGDLNFIAPIITMFFLITYGILNFATLYETLAGNPSYRPRFTFYHWSTALAGTLGCLAIMALIDIVYAVVSLFLLFGIYKYVERQTVKATWGDAKAGFLFSRIRQSLLRLEKSTPHLKNWRPGILVMSGNPNQRLNLIQLASTLEGGKGLILLGNVIEGNLDEMIAKKKKQEEILNTFIEENQLAAFFEVIVAEDFSSGFVALIQSAGVGKLKPNTVMFGLSYDPKRYQMFGNHLRLTYLLGKNIIIVKPQNEETQPKKRCIDIWWRGQENGALMTLFSHLVLLSPDWRDCKIRIIRLVRSESEKEDALMSQNDLIYRARIDAEPKIFVSSESFSQVLKRVSGDSSLVFLGLNIPKSGEDENFFAELSTMLNEMPTVVLVKSLVSEEILLS